MKTLGTIKGTLLVPGVSRNRRLYTHENIGRSVKRMQERLTDPLGLPIVMRTHHDAGDDSSKIVAHVTKVEQQPDGKATYEADIVDTTAGRDIVGLVTPGKSGKAALKTTSIYGYWVGPTEKFEQSDGAVETGDDIEINAIDFTYSPGVSGAQINSVTLESFAARKLLNGKTIMESAEAEVRVAEDYNTAQRKNMAAKGQAMPGGRYPIASKSDLRKAIRAVGRGSGSHATIRQHIMKRAKALGLSNMIPSNWTSENFTVYQGSEKVDPSVLEVFKVKDGDPLSEHYIEVCIGNKDGEMLRICADNLDPDIIKKAIKRAGGLAKEILANNDDGSMEEPDEDDLVDDPDCIDFKVVMASADSMDSADDDSGSNAGENATVEDNELKESAMSETTAATAAPVGESIDYDKIGATVAKAVAETLAAMKKDKKAKAAKNATESTTTPAETKKAETGELKETITPAELEEKLAEERKKTIVELRESLLKENGLPQRQGYRTVVENDGATPTGDELWEQRAKVWSDAYPNVFPALT